VSRLAALGARALRVAPRTELRETDDLEDLSLDELIERLPLVGHEGELDDDDLFVEEPVVAERGRRLRADTELGSTYEHAFSRDSVWTGSAGQCQIDWLPPTSSATPKPATAGRCAGAARTRACSRTGRRRRGGRESS
jgi:hypothetical protein